MYARYRFLITGLSVAFFAGALAFGQTADDTQGGWRRVAQVRTPDLPPLPEYHGDDSAATASQAPASTVPSQVPATPIPRAAGPNPDALVIRPGTMITARIDQQLSSDQSRPGDFFSATLVKPVVVDGVVVAYPGQTVEGQVVEAQKAGRAGGNVSRLVVRLTSLTLADGNQVPMQSQLAARSGSKTGARDFGVVAGTTATGAAIGAMADGGFGAGIGAAIGAAAGMVGVLATRGHPTILYPETVLTFRLDAPVTVITSRAPQAFRYVEPADYDRPPAPLQQPPAQAQARPAPCGPYGCGAPYYYGPSVSWGGPYWRTSVWFGPAFYGGYYYRGGGYYHHH